MRSGLRVAQVARTRRYGSCVDLIVLAVPPKPVNEMTVEGRRAFAELVADVASDRRRSADAAGESQRP